MPGPPVEDWIVNLQRGESASAWDEFIARYRRLIFAGIRHYAQDYDDVMDVFARVCEALREDDLRRLRTWAEQPEHRAKFSTWLVAAVRNLTVDWFRQRDGRRRLSALAERLSPLQRRIFELVFHEHRRHVEAYEIIRIDTPALSFHQFLIELKAAYRAVTHGRRGRLLRELGETPSPETGSEPASLEEVLERHTVLEAALASLSPEDRLAVEMFVLDEVSAATVAKLLKLPNAKTVYNRVYRSLALLKARLEQSGIRFGDL